MTDSNLPKNRERLTPKQKLALIRQVEEGRFSISAACRKADISRKTFYQWRKRYLTAKAKKEKVLEALSPKKKSYAQSYPHRAANLFINEVLEVVKRNPSLSSRKIAKHTSLSEKGVWGVLTRLGLTTYEKRKGFQRLSLAFRPWLALIFIAEYLLGGAIAPEIPLIFPLLSAIPKKRRSIVLYIPLLLLICGAGWKLNQVLFISERTLFGRIGLVCSEIALIFGMFFFLYSLKYYLTLTLVLLFSRGADGSPNGILNGRLNGFLNGLTNRLNGNRLNSFLNGRLNDPSGLNNGLNNNNLNQIKLKEKPFVSIHLPFYNEKRVAGRILEACSRLNYPNFEVLVLDDSNDGTTQIVEEWTKRDERIRLIHRPNREGWKGGALKYALSRMDPRAEYVVVLDADFIPFPDTIEWFLRYFHFLAGGLKNIKKSKIAAVQGYQWHVLNKDENWITRGIRGEYAGSYVIERSGTELFGSLKQIAGSVYMIRADLLKEFGWGTSITEDFQLTLRLYEAGYKVIYTPYIQGPAECIATLKRLIRQRMRWAEGHTHNVRKMFSRISFSPHMNFTEKLEFLYLSPYYLQSLFFLVGTLSWLLAEIIFKARLPFWTATWGWALVFTNMFSLVVMNAAGLFVEESDRRDYKGLLSFIAMTYIIVPFQAYAAIKGLLERQEGPWFRTPKTGIITIELVRGHFRRLFGWLFPRRAGERIRRRLSANQHQFSVNQRFAFATAGNRFSNFIIPRRQGRWIGRSFLSLLLIFSVLLISFAPYAPYFVKQIKTRASGMILGPGQKEKGSTHLGDGSNLEELKPKEISPATYAFKTLDGGVIEIGTEKHSPPQPYLKLDKWEGEASLKVNIPYKTGRSPFQDGDKLRYSTSDLGEQAGILGWIRWLLSKIREILGFPVEAEERPKVEIEFYPKQPEEITEKIAGKPYTFKINEEGGVEFDTILYEKPETNQITFPIEAQGLKFYYQPPLHPDHPTWADENSDGIADSFRPENVVGSYAVYHESKQGDYTQMGGKNYRAGKAFHIYRPKLKDGAGNEIWGELNIDEKAGTLTITIDQNWLNNAVYPITIDPNFGWEGYGGGFTGRGGNNINTTGDTFTGAAGTGISMSAYGDANGPFTINFQMALYDGSSNFVTNGSTGVAKFVQTAGWKTANFSTSPTITASPYYLCINGQNNYNLYYDTGATNNRKYSAQTYGIWPASVSWSSSSGLYKYSIYATYSAKIDTSTSSSPTAYSFQRKTWYDGTRLWSAFHSDDDNRIEFWYSTDWGSNWTENDSARITVDTNDFTIEADSSNAFITYTNGFDIEALKAKTTAPNDYPGTDFQWVTPATTVYDGSSATDEYDYPAMAKDSNSKVWITARHYTSSSSSGGANYPTSATTQAVSPESNSDWTSPGNIAVDDGNYASVYTAVEFWYSYRLKAQNLGFAIPSGATIDGIVVEIERRGSSGSYVKDYRVQLLDASGNLVGNNQADTTNYWPTSDTIKTYGSNSDTWGASPTPAMVNDADFGVVLSERDWNGGATAYVDFIRVTAYYTETTYMFKARQSTTTNDISVWGTASTLDTSTNSNKYGTIVPLSDGEMYAVWIDGTTIEGKKYASYTVDKQVAVGADDGRRHTGSDGFSATENPNLVGYYADSHSLAMHGFARWTGVTIEGTIGANSYIQCYAQNSGALTPELKVYGVDEDNPAAPTTYGQFDADPLTTAAVDWDGAWTINEWAQSGSLAAIFQELVDTYAISNEAVMVQIKNDHAGTGNEYNGIRSWEYPGNLHGPKLHIEYTAWDSSPTTIATGGTGMSNNMSAVADSSGNVHLLYIANFEPPLVDYVAYKKYTTSWQTEVTLDGTAGCDYPTISINTANNDLYAIWVRSNVIYYKKGVSPYGSANWDSTATSWQTSGTNKWVTSNYSGNGMIFAQWTEGTGSPYSVMWDYIIIPEKLLAVLVLGLILPKFWRKRIKDKMKKI